MNYKSFFLVSKVQGSGLGLKSSFELNLDLNVLKSLIQRTREITQSHINATAWHPRLASTLLNGRYLVVASS